MLSMIAKKTRTAVRVVREAGPAMAARLTWETMIQLWHRSPGGLGRVDGCRFRLAGLERDVKIPLLMNEYEMEERDAVRRFLKRDLPVVELGGSIGVVACVINKRLKDRTRHVVVEADPQIIPQLTANRDLNGCRFEILHRVLAYDGDEVFFNTAFDSRGGGVYVEGISRVAVRTVSLEKLARERGFHRFTLVCDIEGSEIDLVEREIDLLSAAVDTIILEVHPKISGMERIETMLSALKDAGFKTLHEKSGTLVLSNTNPASALFRLDTLPSRAS